MVVNLVAAPADTGFASSFVGGSSSLGTRAAVSGATLLEEESEEGRTVVSSLLDGLAEDGGAAVGAARFALDVWSLALRAYCDGQEAIDNAIRHSLDSLPLASASGLAYGRQTGLRTSSKQRGLRLRNWMLSSPYW